MESMAVISNLKNGAHFSQSWYKYFPKQLGQAYFVDCPNRYMIYAINLKDKNCHVPLLIKELVFIFFLFGQT